MLGLGAYPSVRVAIASAFGMFLLGAAGPLHAGEEFVAHSYFVSCGDAVVSVPSIDITVVRAGAEDQGCSAAIDGASRLTDADLIEWIKFSTDEFMTSLIEQDVEFLISAKQGSRLASQLGPLFAAAAIDSDEAVELIELFEELSFQRDAFNYDALNACVFAREQTIVAAELGGNFSELTCTLQVPFEEMTTESFARLDVMVLTINGERTFQIYFPYLNFQ